MASNCEIHKNLNPSKLNTLMVIAWLVSGDPSNQENYQKELWASSRSHGTHLQSHTPVFGDSGTIGVLNGRLIQLQPL